MGDKWPRKTIAECASDEPYSTQIGPFGKALTPEEYTSSGVPLLRGVNVNRGRFYDNGFVFISEETSDRLSKFESFPGDVLLVHKGTLGQIGLMPKDRKHRRYIMGNSMLRVRCDPAKLIPEYLYYWLCSHEGQHYLFSRVSQVGVPQIQRPLTTLREASLPVPPLDEQKEIAHILSTLDDKIELNQQMNRTLEGIARALFKSWFIDFDPVRAKLDGRQPYGMDAETAALFPNSFEDSALGKIPKGWEVRAFGKLLNLTIGGDWGKEEPDDKHDQPIAIIRGTDIAGIKAGSIDKVPHRYTTAQKLKKRSLQNGDLIIEVSGGSRDQPTGRALYITESILSKFQLPVVPASFCRLLRATDPTVALMLKLHLELLYTQGGTWQYQNQSTGISNFQTQYFLENELVIVPSLRIREAFFSKVRPIVDKQFSCERQALENIRDVLLAKLLSGEIRVKDAEQALEAVV
jgi:type I restriction enzyme S subunit